MGISQGRTLTLGQIIDALEKAPPFARVMFDFCDLAPTDVRSWRGDYSELALGWADLSELTAHVLLPRLKDSVGESFEGYKGGTYLMTRDTPVVVDNWGACSNTTIASVDVEGADPDEEGFTGRVLIRTKCNS